MVELLRTEIVRCAIGVRVLGFFRIDSVKQVLQVFITEAWILEGGKCSQRGFSIDVDVFLK